jgi:hypothetical protein
MDAIAWIVLGPGGEPEPALQPGERRTGRADSRLSPLPARGNRVR